MKIPGICSHDALMKLHYLPTGDDSSASKVGTDIFLIFGYFYVSPTNPNP